MEEKREYLVKGRILEKKFSLNRRFLFLLILLSLSMSIKSAETMISLTQYGEQMVLFEETKINIFYDRNNIGRLPFNKIFTNRK